MSSWHRNDKQIHEFHAAAADTHSGRSWCRRSVRGRGARCSGLLMYPCEMLMQGVLVRHGCLDAQAWDVDAGGSDAQRCLDAQVWDVDAGRADAAEVS